MPFILGFYTRICAACTKNYKNRCSSLESNPW
jgi:hypothetical protein